MLLKVRGVTFNYNSIRALENITFEVAESEILGIIGPNGSGKTTLLKCINRVLEPQFGTIFIDGKDTSVLSRKEMAKKVGVVPQNSSLSFPFTVLDVVSMGRTPYLGKFFRKRSYDIKVIETAMGLTGILHLAERRIDELSGGEKQRVIIARALVQQPEIMLLDEPTLHLDVNHQLEILQLIRKLTLKKRLTTLLVTHDLNLAARFCDRLALLSSGKIFAIGSMEKVLTAENIREVYGVNVEVYYHNSSGTWNIILLDICSHSH